jgi:hypothetical protein
MRHTFNRVGCVGASLLLPLVGAIGCGSRETGAVEHDTAALKECIYSETYTGFADAQPGLIDFVIGENTVTGDPRADLPVVVVYGMTAEEAQSRLELGIQQAKMAFPVREITAGGEEGAVAWVAVGPAHIYELNIESDQEPGEVQSRLDEQAEELVTTCLKAARR